MTMTMNANMLQLPQATMMNATTRVSLVVDDMLPSYRLTVDDLQTVFSRYGKVLNIVINQKDGSNATVEFCDYDSASKAIESLNGKVLSGDKGTLKLSLMEEALTRSSTPCTTPMTPNDMPSTPNTGPCTPNTGPFLPLTPNGTPMEQPQGFPHMMPMVPPPGLVADDFFMQQQHQQHHYQPMHQPAPHFDPMYPPQGTMDAFHQQPMYNNFPVDNMHHHAPPAPPMMHYNQGNFAQRYDNGHQGYGNTMPIPQEPPSYNPSPSNMQMPGSNGGASRMCKFTCRFDVGIENEMTFQVARRIIGVKGGNMKRIVRDTGVKLRLRGKGSGFLEGATQESNEPLHLCVSAKNIQEYQYAIREVENLLNGIHREYRAHCQQKLWPTPSLRIVCRQHPLVTMCMNALKNEQAAQQNEYGAQF